VGVVQDLLDLVAGLQQPLGHISEQQHCPPTPIRRLRRHLPHKGEGRLAPTRRVRPARSKFLSTPAPPRGARGACPRGPGFA